MHATTIAPRINKERRSQRRGSIRLTTLTSTPRLSFSLAFVSSSCFYRSGKRPTSPYKPRGGCRDTCRNLFPSNYISALLSDCYGTLFASSGPDNAGSLIRFQRELHFVQRTPHALPTAVEYACVDHRCLHVVRGVVSLVFILALLPHWTNIRLCT